MDLDSKESNLLDLILAVETGNAFGSCHTDKSPPDARETAEGPRPQAEFSAEFIQKLVMALPIEVPGEPTERVIKVTHAGLRIWFARILGELNLEDLTAPGGGALPAMSFDGCSFEGRILLRRSHIRSLSLRDCRFTELRAAGAVFDGPIDLSGIRRPNDVVIKDRSGEERRSRGCHVVLSDAQIGGHLYAGNAHFAAEPREKYMEHSTHAPYALDLRASDIRGSVTLRPGVEAVGGISMNLARIIGSVWCNGAKLTATQERAFSADYAEVQGSLYLRAYDPPDQGESQRFVTRGSVSLFAIKLGGNLYMEGALLQDYRSDNNHDIGEREAAHQSLDLTNATVVGSCKLCYWQSMANNSRVYPFEAEGEIALRAASIGNDISLSWAKVRSVAAANIRIGGDCRMSVFHDSTVGVTDSSMHPIMTANAVHLEGAVIKGDLEMRGAQIGIDSKDKRSGIFARSARIGGNCHLTTFPYDEGVGCPTYRFECRGRIHMQEASVGNSFVMAGSRIVWGGDEPGGALDLSGTTIGGHLKFMTWEPDGPGECLRFEVEGIDIALRLAGTRIAQKLIVNGSVIRKARIAINAANIEIGGKASLSIYQERRPSKVACQQTYCFTASGSVILSSATIKLGLNMTGARLLPTDWDASKLLAAKRYDLASLDLELAHVKFALLRSVACTAPSKTFGENRFPFEAAGEVILLHAEIDTDLDLRESRLWGRLGLDHARVGASINLGHARIWCGLATQVYQEVLAEYEKVDLRQPDRSPKSVLVEQTRHHIAKTIAADLSLRSARVGNALIVVGLEALRATWGPHASTRNTGVAAGWELITIDLRGLHIEELRDEGGAGWGESVRLWMEGFHYSRLTPEVLEISDEMSATNVESKWGLSVFQSKGKWQTAEHNEDFLKLRLRWLNLQYFDKEHPHLAEFTPGAYQHLVKTLNADGFYEEARKVSFAKLKQENVVSYKRSKKLFWWFFRVGFGYGLSPVSAVRTFVLFLLLGSLGAWLGDEGIPGLPFLGLRKVDPVLVVNTSPPQTMIIEEQGSKFSIHPLKIKADNGVVHMDDLPCGSRINPILYALDVFVPVLDLRQQATCSIAANHWLLRVLQALYAVLGWVLTPLTLLTFSGVLKRHLEN